MKLPVYSRIILLFIFLGAIFRILWPYDMEWKADEMLMFNMAAEAIISGNLPFLGMKSGGGIINAGFSVWPFALIYSICNSPIFMGQCVQWLNIASIAILMHCAYQCGEQKRSIMLAGIASYSVAILPVLFSRKIWAQDLLPIFIAIMWLLYTYREKIWPVFLLGIVSALAGQLHLSGFYYAMGLFLMAIVTKNMNRMQIFLFISGAFIAMIPSVLWVKEILHGGESSLSVHNIYKFEFWFHSIIDTLGINVFYSLGSDTVEFAKSYFFLPLIATASILIIFIITIFYNIEYLLKNKIKIDFKNPILFNLFAFAIIPGILLTISGIPVRSHYLIGAFPFLHIFLLHLLSFIKNKWHILFISAQACITILFLLFVHQKQVINGDYGPTYQKTIGIK